MKKLTITVDEDVYEGLYAHIGAGNISRFLNDMARPHVVIDDMEAGYAAMAADEDREHKAMIWTETTFRDIDNG